MRQAKAKATTDQPGFRVRPEQVGSRPMLHVWYPPRVAGSEKDGIIRILAALLHLGNIEFTGASLSCRNGRQTATPNAQPDGLHVTLPCCMPMAVLPGEWPRPTLRTHVGRVLPGRT